jgi:hypothetical protein
MPGKTDASATVRMKRIVEACDMTVIGRLLRNRPSPTAKWARHQVAHFSPVQPAALAIIKR